MTQEHPKGRIPGLPSKPRGGGGVEGGSGYQRWAGDSLGSVAVRPSSVKSAEEEQLGLGTGGVAHAG